MFAAGSGGKPAIRLIVRPPLDCYWVGSSEFHFLVEIKLCCLLLTPKKVKLFAGGSTATKTFGKAHEGSWDEILTIDRNRWVSLLTAFRAVRRRVPWVSWLVFVFLAP